MAAQVVVLRSAETNPTSILVPVLFKTGPVLAEYRQGRWRHAVLEVHGHRYRVSIHQTSPHPTFEYRIAPDSHWATRTAAMTAFHHGLVLDKPVKRPNCLKPQTTEHWRLVQWLRLLDALPDGLKARDLATELILNDVRNLTAADWDNSSARKRIARWQYQALAMRDDGYRNLLNGA